MVIKDFCWQPENVSKNFLGGIFFWGGEGWVSGEVGEQGSIKELCPIF